VGLKKMKHKKMNKISQFFNLMEVNGWFANSVVFAIYTNG
jgi:hypothetical protein